MSESQKQRTNRRFWTVLAGVALGFACWIWVVVADLPAHEVEAEPPASGTVYRSLGGTCALLDDALAERLHGDGVAKDSAGSGSDDEHSTCQWSGGTVTVEIDADRQDYPEGEEVDRSVDEFTSARWSEDEGDPADGQPEDLATPGDEAYAVYDPGAGSEDEDVTVHARSGNVVLTVTVTNSAKREIGHDAMVEQATRFATTALDRVPRS
ncbi:MAG: hypothetical protein GEV10_17200 [Streptosporangiales bacterium]|nr:hypothetical protein [Streptosporangiales bacterium]